MEIISWILILGVSAVLTATFGTLVYVIVLAGIETHEMHKRQQDIRRLRHQIKKQSLQAGIKQS